MQASRETPSFGDVEGSTTLLLAPGPSGWEGGEVARRLVAGADQLSRR